MTLDFTLTKYKELCEVIKSSGYKQLTMQKYLENFNQPNYIILRHDVDKLPENALKMALVEYDFNLNSTYYFRAKRHTFKPSIIQEISGLGHEIGYHYETLADANGNYDLAIEKFKNELEKFREISEIKTICMHGSSLSKWDNRDLWKKFDYSKFSIIGEGYLSLDFENIVYLTDTGGTWDNLKIRIKDISDVKNPKVVKVKNTDDVIDFINDEKEPAIYLQVHPDRWNDNIGNWLKEYSTKKVRNIIKRCIKKYRTIK
ncbi:MAG: hypothetical protein KAJ51_06900 [Thermoplasmata archaeon]|nr:hypothetical protein [Thermoplasmata archaeon]